MTFEEYWAKTAKTVNPPEFNALLKELAEKVWVAGHDEGYKWGHIDATAEHKTDRGHLNP